MEFIDKRIINDSEANVGDILDIKGYGKRLIIFEEDTKKYNVLDLDSGRVQIGWVRSIEEIYEFYGIDRGRNFSIIKNSNIIITLTEGKGE